VSRSRRVALGINYRKFLDPGPIERVPLFGSGGGDGGGANGIYRGDYAHRWIRGELKNLGVSTFGDLAVDRRQPARGNAGTKAGGHRRGPDQGASWCGCHGTIGGFTAVTPDEQSVAQAVRALDVDSVSSFGRCR